MNQLFILFSIIALLNVQFCNTAAVALTNDIETQAAVYTDADNDDSLEFTTNLMVGLDASVADSKKGFSTKFLLDVGFKGTIVNPKSGFAKCEGTFCTVTTATAVEGTYADNGAGKKFMYTVIKTAATLKTPVDYTAVANVDMYNMWYVTDATAAAFAGNDFGVLGLAPNSDFLKSLQNTYTPKTAESDGDSWVGVWVTSKTADVSGEKFALTEPMLNYGLPKAADAERM